MAEVKTTRENRIKKSTGDKITDVIIYFGIGLVGLCTLLPFLYVIAGSFATEKELTERAFFIIPREFSLNSYNYIVQTGDIFKGLKNSIYLTVVGTIINMFFTTTFAYPLSKSYMKGRNALLNMVIVTMLFSGGMIPTYLTIKALGLMNNVMTCILPVCLSSYNIILMKSFFEGIPGTLYEAAELDGATPVGIFARIVLPLSKPALASIGLFIAVGMWNNYMNFVLYITDANKKNFQVKVRELILNDGLSGSSIDISEDMLKNAMVVIVVMPFLIIYPFLQKYFVKGVTIGAVKG